MPRVPLQLASDWRNPLALPGAKIGYSARMANAPHRRMAVNKQGVTATEIVRHFSEWQDRSSERPVTILHHGRPRSILISADHYSKLLAAQGGSDEHAEQLRGQLDVVLARMKSLFIQFDQHQQVLRINGVAARFIGRKPGEVLAQQVSRLFDEQVRDCIATAIQSLFSSGSPQILALSLDSARERCHQVEIVPFPGGGVLFATDITSESTADELLARQDAEQQLLSMMVGCAVGSIEPDGTLLQVHPSLTRLVRFRAHAISQKSFCELFEGQSQRKCSLHIAHIFEGKGPVSCRVDIVTRDRGAVPVRLFLAPKMLKGQVNVALFVILDDALGFLPMR